MDCFSYMNKCIFKVLQNEGDIFVEHFANL